jgi:hypothetical protein
MTADDFRALALELPQAVESSHMGHPDFRVGGKIFATLASPDTDYGMVALKPEQQELIVALDPKAFMPVKGGWGRGGATNVLLKTAKKKLVREALATAWKNKAPKKLLNEIE